MLSPKELANEACQIGLSKVTKRSNIALVSAILAGMFIAFGYYGYIVVSSAFSGAILGKFIGACVFPVGLVIIIITGVDLFTGNCLVFLGFLDRKYCFLKVLKNLGIVYVGNLIGALFLALLIYLSNMASNDSVKSFIIKVCMDKTSLSFIEALTRGILCNIAVAIAVYMSFAAKTVSGKVLTAFYPVMLFVLCGYEHSVANMFILPLGYILQSGNDITILGIINNLIPVTIGNFIGGALILPLAYYFIFVKKRD
ncbi:MAG TPA: formate/nitrite transporter family protein [Haloplasmataceae bacterium]